MKRWISLTAVLALIMSALGIFFYRLLQGRSGGDNNVIGGGNR